MLHTFKFKTSVTPKGIYESKNLMDFRQEFYLTADDSESLILMNNFRRNYMNKSHNFEIRFYFCEIIQKYARIASNSLSNFF